MVTSDVIKTEVSGIIQGAMVLDKKYMSDGSVEVTVGMRLTGALADTFIPKGPATPSAFPTQPSGQNPAVPSQLKEVYGSAWINRDYAVREGMVGYLKDPATAQTNPRVTDKPLMVKAIKVSGDARVDTVISNADAAALQSAAQNMSLLEKCRVIILVD